jgi:Skp family chaperone for outer membrane proteins
MKKFILIPFIILLSLLNNAQANTGIAFLDMEKILSTSNPGLFILNQLEGLSEENRSKLRKDEELIIEKEKKIISKKNIINNDQFEKEINELKLDIREINDDRKKMINNFNKIKLNNTTKLIKLINPLLIKYADENSIIIILKKKNIIMGKKNNDITDAIIEIVNNNIKEFKIQ